MIFYGVGRFGHSFQETSRGSVVQVCSLRPWSAPHFGAGDCFDGGRHPGDAVGGGPGGDASEREPGSHRRSRHQLRPGSDAAADQPGTGRERAAQFCANTSCVITKVYDQSYNWNDLTVEGTGSAAGADHAADAAALPVTLSGHKVYGIDVTGQVGYRDNTTNNIAVNGQPEGMYMVASGTHVNSGCCFDFGNAETSTTDTGNGHMDAVNLGTECYFPPCAGGGPWVEADFGERPVLRGERLEPGQQGQRQQLCDRIAEKQRPDHLRHQRRRRANRRPINMVGRSPAQPDRIQAHAARGRGRVGYRRGQQQLVGRLVLRGCDDPGLPIRRGRQRCPGQHRVRRVRRQLGRIRRGPDRVGYPDRGSGRPA